MSTLTSAEPPRILVADDDPGVRFALTKLLKKAGYSVQSCVDGADALALVEKESFDLLITDLKMPILDGHAVVAKLQALRPKLPVLVLTASSGIEVVERVFAAGVKGFLGKPFEDSERILTKVRTVLSLTLAEENLSEISQRFRAQLPQSDSDS